MHRRRPLSRRLLALLLVGLVGLSLLGGRLAYEVRQTAQLHEQDAATRALQAAILASGDSTDALVATLQEYARQRPNEARGFTLLGAAYLQKARETADPTYYPRADEALATALRLNPDDADALTSMGELALARHQFADALTWGERSWALNAHKARTLGVIGDAQVELGRYEAAIDTIQRMVELRPDLSSYARVSHLRELTGDIEGAIEAMHAAVAAGAPTGENTAYVQVQLGHLYFNSGRLDEAEAQYSAALRTFPGSKLAQAGVARARAARGDLDGAIALYRDVVEVMPLPEFAIALGDLYRAAGRADEAARQDELVRAMSALYAANGVDIDVELARFEAERGLDLPVVVERARRVHAARPSVSVADTLAWALYQDGRYDEAKTAIQQALRLGSRDALIHFHAGMIAARRGDQATAIAALETALRINPYFSIAYSPVARATLAELRATAATGARP